MDQKSGIVRFTLFFHELNQLRDDDLHFHDANDLSSVVVEHRLAHDGITGSTRSNSTMSCLNFVASKALGSVF